MNKRFDPREAPAVSAAEIRQAIDRAHRLRSEEFRRIARRMGGRFHRALDAALHVRPMAGGGATRHCH